MCRIQKGKINLLKNDIYYEIIGEGIPLLMIHGWGVNHRIMSGCMEPIFYNREYHLKRIYFDLPGMGESKADSSIQTSDDVLDIILAFIDAMIPDQPFLLIGESYGGYLARGLLQKRMNQVLGLMLLCPLIYPGYRKGNIPPMTVIKKDEDFLNSLSVKERASFESISIIQTRSVWERYREDIYDTLNLVDSEFLSHLDGAFTYDIDSLDIPFLKPCLLLMGKQDTEVGFIDQFQLLKNYPRASYVVIDKAGHNLQIEQPGLFYSLVCEWFDRVLTEEEKNG